MGSNNKKLRIALLICLKPNDEIMSLGKLAVMLIGARPLTFFSFPCISLYLYLTSFQGTRGPCELQVKFHEVCLIAQIINIKLFYKGKSIFRGTFEIKLL